MKPKYSLRTLLICVTLAAIAIGWCQRVASRAARQREAAAAIDAVGGYFYREAEFLNGKIDPSTTWPDSGRSVNSSGTRRLLNGLIGYYVLNDIIYVCFHDGKPTDGVLTAIRDLPAIQGIDVSVRIGADTRSTQISDRGLEAIADLTTLVHLNVERSVISDQGLRHLIGLKELRHLNVAYTSIGDDGIKQLHDLEHLEYLDLRGTRLTDNGLLALRKLRKLNYLDVDGTLVTETGVREFEATYPRTCIVLLDFMLEELEEGENGSQPAHKGHVQG